MVPLAVAVAVAAVCGTHAGFSASAAAPSPFDGTWRGTITGATATTDSAGNVSSAPCCSKPTVFTVGDGMIWRGGDSALAPGDQFEIWSPAPLGKSGTVYLSSTILDYNDKVDPPLPCVFEAQFTSSGNAHSVGPISCQGANSAGSPTLFRGSFSATRVPGLIDCATVKALAKAAARPVWFPTAQPPGVFSPNANTQSIFRDGLEWSSGKSYFFLNRVPHGANLGEPFPTRLADPYLPNFHVKMKIWRLAKVEGGLLYANWQTSSRSRADLSYAVAKGKTVSQFIAFLSSLDPIVWPTGCAATGH